MLAIVHMHKFPTVMDLSNCLISKRLFARWPYHSSRDALGQEIQHVTVERSLRLFRIELQNADAALARYAA